MTFFVLQHTSIKNLKSISTGRKSEIHLLRISLPNRKWVNNLKASHHNQKIWDPIFSL